MHFIKSIVLLGHSGHLFLKIIPTLYHIINLLRHTLKNHEMLTQ